LFLNLKKGILLKNQLFLRKKTTFRLNKNHVLTTNHKIDMMNLSFSTNFNKKQQKDSL